MNLLTSSTGAAISGRAVRVAVVRQESRAVRSYELVAVDGTSLPAFDAGAHIDVQLGCGLVHSYSLANSPAETGRYVIAVHCELANRGGSAWLHDRVQGDVLTIGAPRNHFPLVDDATHSVLVAGGIGITPMRAMVLRLRSLDRPWTTRAANERPWLSSPSSRTKRVRVVTCASTSMTWKCASEPRRCEAKP